MSKALYSRAFTHIVKFPDDVEPPEGYEPPDEWDDYIGVIGFEKPRRGSEKRIDDGFTGVQQSRSLTVYLEEPVMGKVLPLLNKPIKPDWEVELKMLGKDEKDKPCVTWQSTLTGVSFEQTGEQAVLITYNQYLTKKPAPKGPTGRDGYDFPAGEDIS